MLAFERQVGSQIWWTLDGIFFTSACATAVRLKVYFVAPDGTRYPFSTGTTTDAGPSPCGTRQRFVVHSIAPRLSADEHPERWFPEFWIEVTANGKPLGGFAIFSDIELVPNDFQHERSSQSVNYWLTPGP